MLTSNNKNNNKDKSINGNIDNADTRSVFKINVIINNGSITVA